MLVLGIIDIKNILLYYEIVTAPTFYVDSMHNRHKSNILYYKMATMFTFYASFSDKRHKKSYICKFVTALLIM